uniref:Protein tyrosine phosphatase 4A3b n=1 Tax=Esox lucius TaxID=8010 RepID=A0AAY5KDD9_ESOLU
DKSSAFIHVGRRVNEARPSFTSRDSCTPKRPTPPFPPDVTTGSERFRAVQVIQSVKTTLQPRAFLSPCCTPLTTAGCPTDPLHCAESVRHIKTLPNCQLKSCAKLHPHLSSSFCLKAVYWNCEYDLKTYGATTVVRVCEVTYDKTPLEKDGITVLDWAFDDGAPPPTKIVDDWLNLLKARFVEDPGCCVAVHCVAGLGRAPVLVALALIESGMKYEEAVQFIRQKRRGAINSKQLTYLEKYRSKQRLRFKDPHNHKNKCCAM